MGDENKTKERLHQELKFLHSRLAEVERLETEHKRAEGLLRKSEEKLRVQYQAIPVATYTWRNIGKDFMLVDYNNAAKAITDGGVGDFVGKTATEMYRDNRQDILEDLWRCLTEETMIKRDMSYRFHNTGEKKLLAVTYAFVPPDSVSVHTEDMTERNRVEEALRESEERFRHIAEVFPLPISIIDADGRYLYLNHKFTQVFGYTLEHIPNGKEWFRKAYLDPEYRKKAISLWLSDLEKSGEYEVRIREFRVTCKTGIVKDTVFRTVTMEDGKQLITYEDVTERKRAEEALRESEEKYRGLADLLPQTVFEVDERGNLTFVNRNAFDSFGYSQDDLDKGLNVLQMIVPGDRHRAKDNIQRILGGEKLGGNDYTVLRKDGSTFSVTIYSSSIIREGRPVGLRGIIIDITERKQVEEALQQSEEKYRDLVEKISDVIYAVDKNGVMTYISPAIESILGYSPSEIMGRPFAEFIYKEDLPRMKERFQKILSGDLEPGDYRILDKSGEIRWIRASTRPAFRGSSVMGVQGVLTDITERKRLEQQLLWSQKMETVGRLAGGVAHDFNNLLAIIQGNTELATMEPYLSDRVKNDLQGILKASKRAARLTQQLLAFSRRQIIEPRVVSLNEILLDTDKMLRRLIGEDIELVTLQAENLGRVKVDPGQIEQVLVNLAVNARDAMPEGGKFTVETANVTLDEEYARNHSGVTPGEYAMLVVSDTGIGMPEEVKDHIFEPFFTTKEVGKGTGLGLATCYGIVKQSGGNIWIYSEPGKGTTFKIYFPRVKQEAEALPKHDEEGYLPRGTETVLVVEDEPELRDVVARVLREQGYTVLEATTGEGALRVARKQAGKEIRLLLTDVVMPQMDGKALADRLKAERPDIRAIFFSGYPDEAIAHHGVLDSGVAFLQKPFSPAVLARKVREVLDA